MTLPKGALFDLDDTVIAFDAAAQPVWERLCERYAQRTGKCTPQALLSAVQHVRRWYWSDLARHRKGRQNLKLARRQIVRLAFERLELGDTSLADEIADTYSTERDAAIHCFPGAEETLQHLVDLA